MHSFTHSKNNWTNTSSFFNFHYFFVSEFAKKTRCNSNTFDRWKCVQRPKQHVASLFLTAFEIMDWGNMVLLFCNGKDLEFVAQNIACTKRLMMPSHHSDSCFPVHVRTSPHHGFVIVLYGFEDTFWPFDYYPLNNQKACTQRNIIYQT